MTLWATVEGHVIMTDKSPTPDLPTGVEYRTSHIQQGDHTRWLVIRQGPRGGTRVVSAYPNNAAGKKAATEVASRLDQHCKLEL